MREQLVDQGSPVEEPSFLWFVYISQMVAS